MKIRSGFVSNSSSSSFTCGVCGETQSGMDLSMQCENGHTFCESHQLAADEVSLEDKRMKLVDNVNDSLYYKSNPKLKEAELVSIAECSEDEVNEAYEDVICEDGHSAQECPICTFNELDTAAALAYLLKRNGLNKKDLLAELKEKFPTFAEFSKYAHDK